MYLEPFPKANPHAIDEIMNADLIIISPGGLYTSLIPNLLVEGISKALRESKAKKILVLNLINKHGQTPNFKTTHYLEKMHHFIGKDIFDHIIVNSQKPPRELLEMYAQEGGLVENDLHDGRCIEANLLSSELKEIQKGDLLKRNLIRHDSQKLARELMNIVDNL